MKTIEKVEKVLKIKRSISWTYLLMAIVLIYLSFFSNYKIGRGSDFEEAICCSFAILASIMYLFSFGIISMSFSGYKDALNKEVSKDLYQDDIRTPKVLMFILQTIFSVCVVGSFNFGNNSSIILIFWLLLNILIGVISSMSGLFFVKTIVVDKETDTLLLNPEKKINLSFYVPHGFNVDDWSAQVRNKYLLNERIEA